MKKADLSKDEAVVNKLLRQTINNEVEWEVKSHFTRQDLVLDENFNSLAGSIYVTSITVNGLYGFRLFRYYYNWYDEEGTQHLYQSTQLEMYNPHSGKTTYVLPRMSQFDDLYDAVTKQASGFDDFVKDFLAEE